MESLLPILPLLLVVVACPVGMGLMMWWMNRRMQGHGEMSARPPMQSMGADGPETTSDDVAQLKQRVHELEAKMEGSSGSEKASSQER